MKQGDVLSAIIFNCVMDMAFDAWKLRLHNQDIFVAHGLERLSNTRYADDIMLYAKSLKELVEIAEILIEELSVVGLILNASKTKILHSNIEDDHFGLDFIDISGDFVRILHDDKFHKNLGRHISLSKEQRIQCELKHRRKIGWYAFQKHQKYILNRHISLQRRLHYFDVCVRPAILFGLAVFPLRSQLRDLDIV